MNLVEKLMAVDKKEFEKIETKELASKALSKLLGEEAKVKIQAVDGDLFGALSASGLDEDGEVDYGRAFSTNAKIAAAGIVEPNLKDDALLRHLGVATPADAAKKIFKGEINKIATEISEISGFKSDEETTKEIKN
jgi:hypothetical protein